MSKKPETIFGEKVDLYLQIIGGKWINTHGELFQESGIPDRIGCYKGKYVALELKVPGGEATKKQLKFISDVRKNGGFGEVCESMEEIKNFISAVDKSLQV